VVPLGEVELPLEEPLSEGLLLPEDEPLLPVEEPLLPDDEPERPEE